MMLNLLTTEVIILIFQQPAGGFLPRYLADLEIGLLALNLIHHGFWEVIAGQDDKPDPAGL